MQFEAEAEQILAQSRAVPGFPFLDWPTDPQSLLSLISLWDQAFATALGDAAAQYFAVQDVGTDENSAVYFVRNSEGTRGYRIWAPTAENPGDVAFFFSQIVSPDDRIVDNRVVAHKPRYDLEISSDLSPLRLAAAMTMMHRFAETPVQGSADIAALDAAFKAEFGGLFPQMDLSDDADEDDD